MQQGRSLPRGVLVLSVFGLAGVWLLNSAVTASAGVLSDSLIRYGVPTRPAAYRANAVIGPVADDSMAGPSDGGPSTPNEPERVPTDLAVAAAMEEIKAVAEVFSRLADTTSDVAEQASPAVFAQTYAADAMTLQRWAAAGRIRISDLPPGIDAIVDRDAVIVSRNVVDRHPAEAEGADTLRLAQALLDLPQMAGQAAARGLWAQVHEARLANVAPPVLQDLRPFLIRCWHLQDAYLAVHLRETLPAFAAGSRVPGLSARTLEDAYRELVAKVRATSAAAGDVLTEDWADYRKQVANMAAAALAGGRLVLDRLFAPPNGPPVATEASVSRERLADLQTRLAALNDSLGARDREAAQTSARLRALQDGLKALAAREEGQRTAVQDMVAQVTVGRQLLDRVRAEAEGRQVEVARQMAARDARLANLQSELSGLSATLDVASHDLHALKARVDALRRAQEVATAHGVERSSQHNQRLTSLENETQTLTAAVDEVAGLARKQTILAGEIEVLRAESASRADSLTQLKRHLTAATAIRADLDVVQRRLQHLENDAQKAHIVRQDLAESLAAVAQGLEAQKALTGALRPKTEAIAHRLDRLSTQVGETAPLATLDALKGTLDGLQQRVTSQGAALRAAAQRLTSLAVSVTRSGPRLQAQQARIASLSRSVAQQTDSLSRVEGSLSKVSAALEDLEARLVQKVDRRDLAGRLSVMQQAGERQMSRMASQSGRLSDLEQQTANLNTAAGRLKERMSYLEHNATAEVADLRGQLDDVDRRAAAALWAALSPLVIAGVSAVVAFILIGRHMRSQQALGAAAHNEDMETTGASDQRPPAALAGPPNETFEKPADDEFVTGTRRAEARARRLHRLDELLAKLSFAIHADQEKAASNRRALVATQHAVRAQAREAAKAAAELESLHSAVALAKERVDLRARAKDASADIKALQAVRRRLCQVDKDVGTLHFSVRNACRKLLATIESIKEVPSVDLGSQVRVPGKRVSTAANAQERKAPDDASEMEQGRPVFHEGTELGEVMQHFNLEAEHRNRVTDAIRRADIKAFIREFADLTGLSQRRIGLMLFAGDGGDLAVAFRAAGIAKAHFAALLIIARRGRSENRVRLLDNLARAIHCYEDISRQSAVEKTRSWQTAERGGVFAIGDEL